MKNLNVLYISTLALLFTINNAKANDNQVYSQETNQTTIITDSDNIKKDELLEHFFSPIKFTRQGVNCFIKHTFNHREYKNFLPHHLKHIEQFLLYGNKTQQDNSYPQTVFKLFMSKIKESTFVNAYAFEEFIQELPELLGQYFDNSEQQIDTKNFIKKIKNIIYRKFISKFSDFKQEPGEFIENLSNEIVKASNTTITVEKAVSKEKLRQTCIRFLEISLSKLVWSPFDHENIWPNIKEIGLSIKKLSDCNIIDDISDKNDLYSSLVIQFCKFIQLSGSDVPTKFYEIIAEDLKNNAPEFLTTPEQEDSIKNKNKMLKESLVQGATKSRAREHGIISDPISR